MKYLSKIISVLLTLTMLSGIVLSVSAQDLPEDGLYTISVTSSSDKFIIEHCVLRVQDGKMTATMTMSGKGYGYFYPRTGAEADAAGEEKWYPYRTAENGNHQFTVPIEALDQEMNLASYSIRKSKWYDRVVVFHSDTMKPYQEVAKDGTYSAQITSDTLHDAQCILTAKDGKMTAAITQGEETVEAALESLDVMVNVQLAGKEHRLAVESLSLKPVRFVPKDGSYRVKAESDSPLLQIKEAELVVENGTFTAKLTCDHNKYAALYLGTASDALKAPEEERFGIDENNTYTIPVSSLDQELPIATYDQEKNRWYDRTILLHSDSLLDADGKAPQLEMLLPTEEETEETTETTKPAEPADKQDEAKEPAVQESQTAPTNAQEASSDAVVWIILGCIVIAAVVGLVLRKRKK